jgi:hypothetical protein
MKSMNIKCMMLTGTTVSWPGGWRRIWVDVFAGIAHEKPRP